MEVIDSELFGIFLSSIPLHLIALLAGGIFLLMAGIRELKEGVMQGALSVALGLFLIAGHLVYLTNLPEESGYGPSTLSMLSWAINYLAPSIVALLIVRGLWDLIFRFNPNGLIRIFWGMTLVCYLYILGQAWPLDLKAAVVSFYLVIFLITETDPSDEPMLSAWRY